MAVIEIKPIGNLGNRMIQYLAALNVARFCDGTILNPCVPEWAIDHDDKKIDYEKGETLSLRVDKIIPFGTIKELVCSGKFTKIIIEDHMQRIECLPSVEIAKQIFKQDINVDSFKYSDLVINIRAAELVSGIGHYPLVPLEFYEKIIKETKLRPIFIGQIGENEYCNRLKNIFSEAIFIPSRGALEDLALLRSAKHLVISVSTFSWLAGWLSNAVQIFVPMIGFLNPMHFGGRKIIDLLPVNDCRFRFFSFPLMYGIPELQAFKAHPKIMPFCLEISSKMVDQRRLNNSFIEVDPCLSDFDECWYCNEYIDAANEISLGHYRTPIEHFTDVGILRGYLPMPTGISYRIPEVLLPLYDLAKGQHAETSSVSAWSKKSTCVLEGQNATTDDDNEPFAFHTEAEWNPFWICDLKTLKQIHYLVISNRIENDVIRGRSTPISIQTSEDGSIYTERYLTPSGFIPSRPFTWRPEEPVVARYVRLQIPRRSFFHLKGIKIIGCEL